MRMVETTAISENRTGVNGIDIMVTAFFVYCAVNALVVSDVPCRTESLTIALCFGLYLIFRVLFSFRLPSDMFVAYLLLIVGEYEVIVGFLQLFGFIQSGHTHYAVTGTFPNPGPFGGFIAISLSAGFWLYRHRGGGWVMYAMLPMMIALLVSMSRGAWLALVVSLSVLYRDRLRFEKRYAVAGIILIAAVGVAVYLIKRGSADGRVAMAFMALKACGVSPFLGWGAGGVLYAISEMQIMHFSSYPDSALISVTGVADYPFNEYLHVAVEFGIIGLLLFLSVVVSVFRKLYVAGRVEMYPFLTFLVFAIFSYPFSLLPFGVLFILIVALAAGIEGDFRSGKNGVFGIITLVIGVLITVGSLVCYVPVIRASEIFAGYGNISNPASINPARELSADLSDNRDFLFSYGKSLRESGRYNDSNAILRQGMLVCNDPMMRIVMGRNYESLSCYDKAEEMYLQAFHMQPNRLYPLYRMMLLQEATGDSIRTKEYANKVLEFDPKVQSPAIREMKWKAKEIINQM